MIGQKAPRAGCGVYHSPSWWWHGRAASPAPGSHFPLCPFVFPCGFSVYAAILALKEWCIWPYLGVEFIT